MSKAERLRRHVAVSCRPFYIFSSLLLVDLERASFQSAHSRNSVYIFSLLTISSSSLSTAFLRYLTDIMGIQESQRDAE